MWIKGPLPTEESGEWSGLCGIPEELDLSDIDFHEGPDEDEFVKILIEVMSRPMSPERIEQIKRGGYCG